MKKFAGISQTRPKIFLSQSRITVENLSVGPACRQKINDHLDRNPRPFDDRFADKDSRVERDAVTPVHAFNITDCSVASACRRGE